MAEEHLIGNVGSRPVPDPTELTDQAIAKAEKALRDYIRGEIKVLEERLHGVDRATELRLSDIISIPKEIDEKVTHLQELMKERFASVDQRFTERDIRSEREARDNKVAVDAAFAAQKEAAAKQDEANAKAIDKSEKATAETIKTNFDLSTTQNSALSDKIDDLKERMSRIESAKQGAVEQRIETRAGLSANVLILGALATVITIVALIIGLRTSTARKSMSSQQSTLITQL